MPGCTRSKHEMLCKLIFLSQSLPGECATPCRIKLHFGKGGIQASFLLEIL